jgi:putative addiction module antidote
MLRKVFKTGNSIVVSLPKDMLEPLNVAEGDEVSLELDRKNQQIVIRPVEKAIAVHIDASFARQVAEFIEQYRPALESLARR